MEEVKEKKITKKELARLERLEKKRKWEECRQKVIARDNGCIICGSKKQMNVHHIIPRENDEYFYDINNLVTLCIKHHKFGSPKADLSAHRNSFPFYLWLQQNRPEQFEYCKKISMKLFLENIKMEDCPGYVQFVW
jgi:hypothetical protein